MKRIIILVLCTVFLASFGFSAEKSNPPLQTMPQAGTITPAGPPHPIGSCCISGKYRGEKEDTSCVPGHTPKRSKFTMDITQAGGCGGTFTAVVTDSHDGVTTNLSGTVAPGSPRGCCQIEGRSTSGTDNIQFKGTMCKKDGKWDVSGTFKTVHCKGNWKMTQM